MPDSTVDLQSAKAVAEDLWLQNGFTKSTVSERLAKADKQTFEIRRLYLEHFEFKSQTVLEALREFLGKLVLKGETQEQDRILESFANRYSQCNPDFFNATFVHKLVYSLILLNTDLHNASMKGMNKMTLEQFLDNTIPTLESDLSDDEKAKIDAELLKEFYRSVAETPILQPEDDVAKELASEEAYQGGFGGVLSSLLRPPKGSTLLRNFTLKKNKDSSSTFGSQLSLASITGDDRKISCPAPYREGILLRKHVLESQNAKAVSRQWKDFYCVMNGSDIMFYRVPVPSRSVAAMVSALKLVDFIPLRHCVASALLPPGYSPNRAYCFQLVLPNGGLYVFQAFSELAVREWVSVINYWAARESREPLPVPVGSIWYGFEREWCMDFISGGAEETERLEKEAESAKDPALSRINTNCSVKTPDTEIASADTSEYFSPISESTETYTIKFQLKLLSEVVKDVLAVGGSVFKDSLFIEEEQPVVEEKPIELEPPRREFGKVKDTSIAEWKTPSFPFVPASHSKAKEEVSIFGKSARNTDVPFGFDREKLPKPEKQLRMWQERYRKLKEEVTEHLASREILKNLGIGKGIQELIVVPDMGKGKHGAVSRAMDKTGISPVSNDSSSTLRRKPTFFGKKTNSSGNLISNLNETGGDIDNIMQFASKAKGFPGSISTNSLESNESLTPTALSRSNSVNRIFQQKSSLSSHATNHSEESSMSLGTTDGEANVYWHPKLVYITAGTTVPRLTPRSDSLADLNQRSNGGSGTVTKRSKNSHEKGWFVTLPPPSNITLEIPPLPKALLNCIYSPPRPDLGFDPLPKFSSINPKLSNRIDKNWLNKFEFLQWELCKVSHYVRALQDGVTMSTPFKKPTEPSSDQKQKSRPAKLKKRPNAQTLTLGTKSGSQTIGSSRGAIFSGTETSDHDDSQLDSPKADTMHGSSASLNRSGDDLAGKLHWLTFLDQGEGIDGVGNH